MKDECFVCENFTREKVSKEITIAKTKVFVQDAPAEVCIKCGSIYFDGKYIEQLEKDVKKAQLQPA